MAKFKAKRDQLIAFRETKQFRKQAELVNKFINHLSDLPYENRLLIKNRCVMKQVEVERERLLHELKECEESLKDCTIERFCELRYQFKQLTEKLRSLDSNNRPNRGLPQMIVESSFFSPACFLPLA